MYDSEEIKLKIGELFSELFYTNRGHRAFILQAFLTRNGYLLKKLENNIGHRTYR